jgi:hypothetical protein
MITLGASRVSIAVNTHDPKARAIARLEDFAYVKEVTQLLAAQTLGLLDKNERSILEDGLSLRNKCAHPGNYSPGVKKVGAFVEDIAGVAFS